MLTIHSSRDFARAPEELTSSDKFRRLAKTSFRTSKLEAGGGQCRLQIFFIRKREESAIDTTAYLNTAVWGKLS